MRFNTTHYEFNHGVKPRGRGNWHFSFVSRDGERRYVTGPTLATLTEAKRCALRHARAQGATELRVEA